MSDIPYKIYLDESDLPTEWYNVRADMKNKPAPLLNPGTGQPLTAEEMGGHFLRGSGGPGAGRRHRLCPHPGGDPGVL